MKPLLFLAMVAVGCGGKHAPATSGTGPEGGESEVAVAAGDGDIVPPEQMDEINRSLERKRTVVSRCLAIAIDNKELPKSSAGKITLDIVIAGGKAETVKVVRSTLDSPSLNACVIGHVKAIQFPELAKPYPTSFTYGFEAM